MALDQAEKNIDLAQAERGPASEQPSLPQEQIKAQAAQSVLKSDAANKVNFFC
jgi:hypothetical protein